MSRKHLQLYELLTQTPFKRPQRHNKSICTSTAFQELLQTDDDVIHYRLRNQLSITSPLTSGQCTVVLNTRTCWKRCHLDIRRTATVAYHRTDLRKHPSPVQHGGNAHEAGESTIPGRRGEIDTTPVGADLRVFVILPGRAPVSIFVREQLIKTTKRLPG